MKKLGLFVGSQSTAKVLEEQLKSFLSDAVEIKVFIQDQGIGPIGPLDFVIFSSHALYEEIQSVFVKHLNTPFIIGSRTVSDECIDQIVEIPKGTKVLLVNDVEESAREVHQALMDIGLDHIDYELFYPDQLNPQSDLEIAITAGEARHVPCEMKHIIDIGPRIFDFKTLARLLSSLGLLDGYTKSFSKMYLKKIIHMAQHLSESKRQVMVLNEHLNRVIESFETGLLMYDCHGQIIFLNDALKHMLKLRHFHFGGKKLHQVIYNKKLLLLLKDEQDQEAFPIRLTIDGVLYHIEKFKVATSDYIGVSFKPESSLTSHCVQEHQKKGFVAKYGIEDIVGESKGIKEVKQVIEKLGPTQMSILIQGESGTGKELVASALHRMSHRKKAPFLAVNFSALPDDLIESELFGYVDGAFTGARKGGKRGLFQEADGGTIFLDEIGDSSLKVQARLLRVLEEREVMPIGGNEIIPVDVRIIAATNKNLLKMIEEKRFREDLYYRLKMGSIELPPLRERREDIPLLVNHLIAMNSSESVVFDQKTMGYLKNESWLGNVRELKNKIIYLIATGQRLEENQSKKEVTLTSEQKHFLTWIIEHEKKGKTLSRSKLSDYSQKTAFKRTENQVRRILKDLEKSGYLGIKKGRHGIKITIKATMWYDNIQKNRNNNH